MQLVSDNFNIRIKDLVDNKSNYTHSEQLAILFNLYKDFVYEKTILDKLKIHMKKPVYVRGIDRLLLQDILNVLYTSKEVNFNIYRGVIDVIDIYNKPHTLLKLDIPITDKVYTTTSEFTQLVKVLGVDGVIDLFSMLVYIKHGHI